MDHGLHRALTIDPEMRYMISNPLLRLAWDFLILSTGSCASQEPLQTQTN